MLHHIEEPCSLGAHAAVIVPPTWIIKVKKPQVTAGSWCCWPSAEETNGCGLLFSLSSLWDPVTFTHSPPWSGA